MSTTATLLVDTLSGPAAPARRVLLDCKHGVTTVITICPPGAAVQITDADATRMALLKHLDEQPACRCTRRLWREHFGCDWPDVPLAWGQA